MNLVEKFQSEEQCDLMNLVEKFQSEEQCALVIARKYESWAKKWRHWPHLPGRELIRSTLHLNAMSSHYAAVATLNQLSSRSLDN